MALVESAAGSSNKGMRMSDKKTAINTGASQGIGAATTEVASSHVPMLSHPDLVIDVIRTAAKAVQEATAAA